MTTPEAAKHEAMTRAERGANPAWKAAISALIEELAYCRPTFTADDIFALADARGFPKTHENRALGPLLTNAARKGLCRPSLVYVSSKRPWLHAKILRVWESAVYMPVEEFVSYVCGEDA